MLRRIDLDREIRKLQCISCSSVLSFIAVLLVDSHTLVAGIAGAWGLSILLIAIAPDRWFGREPPLPPRPRQS